MRQQSLSLPPQPALHQEGPRGLWLSPGRGKEEGAPAREGGYSLSQSLLHCLTMSVESEFSLFKINRFSFKVFQSPLLMTPLNPPCG